MKEEENNQQHKGIVERNIVREMQESYLDYAMSVIVARALPDVRDGLKPVHRRVLYAMHEMGLSAGAKHRKSAAIVGDTLGKYHPHGDSAVYDSLVRMAQDFSLRYPLVDGQGNFGCFTKDTRVALTDGRNATFEELVAEDAQGKKNYTYTINSIGLISIAEIKKPRLTKKNTEIIKITLDNNEEIRCTPNHLFMARNGAYKEAAKLEVGESLMPLYHRLSEKSDRINREGYLLIYQNKTGEWVPSHHLADNYNLTKQTYLPKTGRVRHHIDFNKLNNNPDNITRMGWGDHWRIHYEYAARMHKNEDYRKKISEGRNRFWSIIENRNLYAARMSERNHKNWQDAEYREKMRKFLSEVNKEYIKNHPKKRDELSKRATHTLKRLWKDPMYRKLFNEKIVASNKKRITNNTGKAKFIKVCSEVFKTHNTINQELYEQKRNAVYGYGCATSWDTGIKKYYKDAKKILLQEFVKNHKVKKVEFLHTQENVYDLTIDGTHNFALAAGIFVHNSIDGDAAAAMRYTEARMTKITAEMMRDIEKDTVDFIDNYDGTRKEPKVLPASLPQLLLNGSLGIAVGMATNIAPHNVKEVIDATVLLIDKPKSTIEDLTHLIKGPDFPTGGVIFNEKEIQQAYATGRGGIVTRGEAEIVEKKQGAFQILVTSIPYQVSKAELITKMADLVHEKKLEGIRDIRDESDRDGLTIAIDLSRDAFPQKVLNALYKHTDLEKTFHFNMIALVDGIQPQLLSLKSILEHFINHRKVVVERRTKFDLARAQDRAHILEGLKKALDHIDAIIQTIKKSPDKDAAHERIMEKFKLSDKQSTAILEMRLQTLAGLERQKIEDELKEKEKLIKHLMSLLKDPQKMLEVIKEELAAIKEKYGDDRKTKVISRAIKSFSAEDLIPNKPAFIILTKGGYVKRVDPQEYRGQNRGGKGISAMSMKEEDLIDTVISGNTHDDLLFFTNTGKVYKTKSYEIPEGKRTTKGKSVVNFLALGPSETITSIIPITKEEKKKNFFLLMVTESGVIKKVESAHFDDVRRSGIIALKLQKNDTLRWVRLTEKNDHVLLASKKGIGIRFRESDVRPMGRTAGGVRAMRLRQGDMLVGADVLSSQEKEASFFVISEKGYGKKTPVKEYRMQKRGGSGIKTMNVTAKTGALMDAKIITDQTELIAISKKGQIIRTKVDQVPKLGRSTQGVRLMKLDGTDSIASITLL